MDRRLFLISTLALAGCGDGDRPQTILCDPGLGVPLTRAREAYGEIGAIALYEARPAALLSRAKAERSALVVTRQALIANQLQRLGYVRLEHRWQARIGPETAEIMVTKGDGGAQRKAVSFARWLASEAAMPVLADAPPIAP